MNHILKFWKGLNSPLKVCLVLEISCLALIFSAAALGAAGQISVSDMVSAVSALLILAIVAVGALAILDLVILWSRQSTLWAPPRVDAVLQVLENKHGRIFSVTSLPGSDEVLIRRDAQIVYRHRKDFHYLLLWPLDNLMRVHSAKTLQDILTIVEGKGGHLAGPLQNDTDKVQIPKYLRPGGDADKLIDTELQSYSD